MDILQVNKLAPPWIGGVEVHVDTLCRALVRLPGVSLTLLAAAHPGVEANTPYRIERVPHFGLVWSMPLAPGFIPMLARQQADILHFHLPFPLGALAYYLARPRGHVFVTWHATVLRQRVAEPLFHPFMHNLLNAAERIVLTHPHEHGLPGPLKPFKAKTRVIPMGIDLEWLRPTDTLMARAHTLRHRFGPRIVLFVGRFVYYKGLEYLLHAIKTIDANLVLIGDGPLAARLKRMASDLNIARRVIFHGVALPEDLAAFYHACDLFVLPSTEVTEAYGLVQLEAMACGKPVVSTSLPTGVPFVNQHGVTGLVVAPGSPAELTAAIQRLLTDAALRERLGAQARDRVQREFTAERMAVRHLDLYTNGVGGPVRG